MSRDPAAWRSSLEARLRNTSERTGVDVGRLRRHLVFQRMLARLAGDERWVLKGGFALEVRFSLASRATKDLDLVVLGEIEGTQLQDLFDEALDREVDNDQFTFLVSTPKSISSDEAGSPGWRLTVVAKLAGRDFAQVAVDVVARSEEIAGAISTLAVEPIIAGVDLEVVRMPAVDLAQQAAEKFHALARRYAGDRPSSRVKDLVDLVLLAESGLLAAQPLGIRLGHVYAVRDGSQPPRVLPDPPAAWLVTYAALARELDLGAADVESAMTLVSRLYVEALTFLPDPNTEEAKR
jgi:predicted nucleotidyltransferase component of viral defense system